MAKTPMTSYEKKGLAISFCIICIVAYTFPLLL